MGVCEGILMRGRVQAAEQQMQLVQINAIHFNIPESRGQRSYCVRNQMRSRDLPTPPQSTQYCQMSSQFPGMDGCLGVEVATR